MNEMLSELNIKSMSDNWKGYAAVANKFSTILIHSIDLKLPVLCLCYEVNKNLTSIEHKVNIKNCFAYVWLINMSSTENYGMELCLRLHFIYFILFSENSCQYF